MEDHSKPVAFRLGFLVIPLSAISRVDERLLMVYLIDGCQFPISATLAGRLAAEFNVLQD